jgi:hypothetical protein
VTVGDFNSDGKPIWLVGKSANMVSILLGRDGTLVATLTLLWQWSCFRGYRGFQWRREA